MRLQDNVIAAHAAPATSVPITGFHKVDGAFILGAPCTFHHLIPGLIHLNEAAGRKNRIHGEILVADVPVSKIAVRKLSQVG
jgi:hypothetical protein